MLLKEIFDAKHHKTATVWPTISLLTNHLIKIKKPYGKLLVTFGQTYKRRSFIDSQIWMCHCWSGCKEFTCRGEIVVAGNKHDCTSWNAGLNKVFAFHIARKAWIKHSSLQLWVGQIQFVSLGLGLVSFVNPAIGLMSRVFANGLEDRGLIAGWVIPKTQKMVLNAALLNTQHYKVRIKGKVEESRECSCAFPYTSV